ncbi:MAG: MATE family efflux transporter [Clostridia bacterium]|nr:MATE family efflux transporter [Clostridia bacterium]
MTKAIRPSKSKDKDMTEGSIVKHIILFSLPLLVGNVFQQLYNTVDTWVVGNYVSNEAFSAVGSVGPIVNVLIGTFMGLASGAGVVISQFYGAGRLDKVQDTVHTCIAITAILSVVFTVVGITTTPLMLQAMKIPDEVYPEARKYLIIYFAGVTGLLFYNMGSGILRAVGDSRRPFIFLVVSAVLNTVLDLVFVLILGMGVEGVAYATIIAQGVSAILVMLTLMTSDSCIKVVFRKIRIHLEQLKLILRVGTPAAIQLAITAFSNVFVQSYINYFGTDCMSGWTTYTKLDQFMFLPMQSVSIAATTFVGQNLGKGNLDRAKEGVKKAYIMSLTCTAVIMVPLMLFAPQASAFFNDKPEVIEYSTLLLHWLSPFYLTCCMNQVYAAALRGAGNSKVPMIIMLGSFVLFRQTYLFIMANFIANEIIPIAMGYPAGWIICSVITYIYYKKTDLMKTKLVA